MKRRIVRTLLPLCLMGCLFGGGCSVNGLLKNIWIGFGEAIGAMPGEIAAGYVQDTLFGDEGVSPSPQ